MLIGRILNKINEWITFSVTDQSVWQVYDCVKGFIVKTTKLWILDNNNQYTEVCDCAEQEETWVWQVFVFSK